MMVKTDFYVAIVLLAFCGLAYGEAYFYPHASAYFPRMIIFLLAGMSCALLAKSLLEVRKEKAAVHRLPGAMEAPSFWKKEVFRKVFLMIAVSTVYLLIMSSIGFYLTTLAYLPVMIWLLGVRKPRVIVLSTVFVLIFIYLVFSAFLRVPIPEGIAF